MEHFRRLGDLIDSFLEDRRESFGGGWAQITPEDVDQLREIIRWLIELKCDRDADGDLPIECKLVNRRTHERLHYYPIPYREQRNDDGNVGHTYTRMELMHLMLSNLSHASDRLTTEFRCADLFP